MTIQDILSLSKVSPAFSARIMGFSDLCDELCHLTEQENDVFLSNDLQAGMAISWRKIALLKQFEEKTQHIFDIIKEEAPHNLALQNQLIDKIQTLQGKLKINTGLHLHIMGQLHQQTNDCEGTTQCH